MYSEKLKFIDMTTEQAEREMVDALRWCGTSLGQGFGRAAPPDKQMTGAINEALDAIRTVRQLVKLRSEGKLGKEAGHDCPF